MVVFIALIGFSIWFRFRDNPSLCFIVLEKPSLNLGRLLKIFEEESWVSYQMYQNLKPYKFKTNHKIHIYSAH